ncbi:High-affinity zinc uptake system membrane protein ZnuB [Pelotomaculum schinkii]|uniref:High-affinity zinc uptake system membrane protein ZnuB n=1 Tax=Pelotomaculum schinkii TaxID=78350 RepID=A0A4Y7RC06_9FIRM|nr:MULTISPECIES: metal ABC transporter permease [Pelotomaculum]TEB06514.1 High-affinity zinc uptake system membrane protein ZnuB [Pelotomaculum schinkii]TEB15205.1 High-affinity zinc uptake system membrane protein ZnuB [Pelotomaculum sp. FP]
MELWYAFVSHMLPFAWASHGFMKNALLAVLLVGPMFAIMGTMVVNNKMAFFSDTIGHSSLTGIAIGVLLGFQDPLWIMLVFSVFLAVAISMLKLWTTAPTDTVIGSVAAIMVALGIVLLSRGGGFAKFSRFLIGDILSITSGEVLLLAIALGGVLLLWGLMFNKFLLVSVNQSVALSRGIPVRLVEIIFCVATAIIVTISIQWVGILIINSFLILPAAAARNVTGNMMSYHIVSVLITIFSGVAGLLLSYYWATATGATIVLITALFYLATLLMKPRLA